MGRDERKAVLILEPEMKQVPPYFFGGGNVFHWFTGTIPQLEKAIEKELNRAALKISDIVKSDMMDIFCENAKEVFKY